MAHSVGLYRKSVDDNGRYTTRNLSMLIPIMVKTEVLAATVSRKGANLPENKEIFK